MFEHPRMEDRRAKDLLAGILNDGKIVRRKFVPASGPAIDRLSEWEKLREELDVSQPLFPRGHY